MNHRALAAMFAVGAKKVLAERAVLMGQIVVYWVIVSAYGVFYAGVSPASLGRFGLTVPQLIWYFAMTQAVVGCTPLHWREMERDVHEGRLELHLLRPIAFWKLMLAEWYGQYAVRLILVAPFGFLAAWTISGGLPLGSIVPLLAAIPCLLLAGLLFLCLHWVIGCTSLWASPAEPTYRFWQKFMYLVGARSSPLLLYPLWARSLVWFTPFPAILAVPGNLVLGVSRPQFAGQLLFQLGWVVAGLWAASRMAEAVRLRIMRVG